jgi:hypothetical protein
MAEWGVSDRGDRCAVATVAVAIEWIPSDGCRGNECRAVTPRGTRSRSGAEARDDGADQQAG